MARCVISSLVSSSMGFSSTELSVVVVVVESGLWSGGPPPLGSAMRGVVSVALVLSIAPVGGGLSSSYSAGKKRAVKQHVQHHKATNLPRYVCQGSLAQPAR